MTNKPDNNWSKTGEQMYKSVEDRQKKRKEHIKEYFLIGAAMLLIGGILIAIMSL